VERDSGLRKITCVWKARLGSLFISSTDQSPSEAGPENGVGSKVIRQPAHEQPVGPVLRQGAIHIARLDQRAGLQGVLVQVLEGVFYVAEPKENNGIRLRMVSSFAGQPRPGSPLEFALGEGLVGQCALDKKRLVPEDKLETTVKDLVARMTGHSGPVLTMAKKAILGGMGLSLRDGLKHSMNIFLNELYRLEDSQEGLQALVEKRKPNWKNR